MWGKKTPDEQFYLVTWYRIGSKLEQRLVNVVFLLFFFTKNYDYIIINAKRGVVYG